MCYPGAPPFLNRYANWSQRRALDALLAPVRPLSGRRVLDVGCGTGRWTRFLAARGARVCGVDRSEAMVAEARRRGGGEFRTMDATRLDLPDDTFDLAVAVTVLQHLEPAQQAAAAREVARVVRSGGFVLTVDRVGRASAFSAAHGTFPRARDEWPELWRSVGSDLVLARGQEFSYPLALARLGRRAVPAATAPDYRTTRRGRAGWRRVVLAGLVGASYAVEVVAEHVPNAPAAHLAALYVVR